MTIWKKSRVMWRSGDDMEEIESGVMWRSCDDMKEIESDVKVV